MDNPDLMDCENETRLNILACSLDVAEIDPEFILKVINYYRSNNLIGRRQFDKIDNKYHIIKNFGERKIFYLYTAYR